MTIDQSITYFNKKKGKQVTELVIFYTKIDFYKKKEKGNPLKVCEFQKLNEHPLIADNIIKKIKNLVCYLKIFYK